jgi:hypothetical protein
VRKRKPAVKPCKGCFFSEVSLRNNSGDHSGTTYLWCWWKEEHTFRSKSCRQWRPKDTEGDPKQFAIELKEFQRKEREAKFSY